MLYSQKPAQVEGKSYRSLGRFLKSDATKLLIIGLAGKVGEWEEDILYLEEHMGSDKITVDEIGIVKKGMTYLLS